MNTTTYYDLKTYESTDKVNPITVDGTNMEAIDDALHLNAMAGVGTATELKSGSVHEITRTDDETAVFRFTATTDFEAGDTFTVDDIQVTAKMPNGENLPNNAYVTGSTVLCALVGSQLTIYVAPSNALALDSEKLGGELPAYYAKTSVTDTLNLTVNALGAVVDNQTLEINGLKNNKLQLVYMPIDYFSGTHGWTVTNAGQLFNDIAADATIPDIAIMRVVNGYRYLGLYLRFEDYYEAFLCFTYASLTPYLLIKTPTSGVVVKKLQTIE